MPTIGSTLPLAYDWSRSNKTLVLVLSETCRFCDESASFYQTLLNQFSDRNKIQFVAVFPQDAVSAKKHLADLNVQIVEVIQSPVSTLKVSGTPTLILVDNTGKVIDFWVGKLSASGEAALVERLRL
jgi:thioredoxin-related protein